MKERIFEIDFFRGIALILMIFYHVLYDFNEIFNYSIQYDSGIFFIIGKLSGILFIIISGISSTLSHNNIKRGMKLLLYGTFLTIITFIFYREYTILFGILHFLGLSLIIYKLFYKIDYKYIIFISSIIILFGNYIYKINFNYNFLFPIGIINKSFYSADYYPLIPWFGVFLLGTVIGRVFYKDKKSYLKFIKKDNIISYIGRNTLIIYLLHQPVILLLIYIIESLYKIN